MQQLLIIYGLLILAIDLLLEVLLHVVVWIADRRRRAQGEESVDESRRAAQLVRHARLSNSDPFEGTELAHRSGRG